MNRSAEFSSDGGRRFDLVRDWRDEIGAPNRTLLVCGLNPSKAGGEVDDPTARKIVGFARRWGFGRAVTVNLDPHVSTDPWDLPYWSGIDPMNRAIIARWLAESHLVLAAWGHPPRAIRDRIAFFELTLDFCGQVKVAGFQELHCIGTTLRGFPLHPSRTAYTFAPVAFKKLSNKQKGVA